MSFGKDIILIIAFILTLLVAINFLLLIFSINKTPKKSKEKKPRILPSERRLSSPLFTNQLPPTILDK